VSAVAQRQYDLAVVDAELVEVVTQRLTGDQLVAASVGVQRLNRHATRIGA
jgi:hypothetical protein